MQIKQKIAKLAKKASLSELFYDLVFVLAISKFENIFEHSGGESHHIAIIDFLKLGVILVTLINIWITKTVFVNRYGKDTLVEKIFMLIDMSFIMYLAMSINSEWEKTFKDFLLALSFITFSFVCQFIYYLLKNRKDCLYRKAFFAYITFFTIIGTMLLIGSQLSYSKAVHLCVGLLIISWIVPHFIRFFFKEKAINLPHAIERINLLTIIFFGEMLISFSSFFKQLDWQGILAILFCGSLFLYYTVHCEDMIDHHQENKRSYFLFIIHYFIFISLILISLDFKFSLNNHLDEHEVWTVGYVAIFIYVISLFILLSIFGKKEFRFKLWQLLISLSLVGIVYGLGFIKPSDIKYHFYLTSSVAVVLVCFLYAFKHYSIWKSKNLITKQSDPLTKS